MTVKKIFSSFYYIIRTMGRTHIHPLYKMKGLSVGPFSRSRGGYNSSDSL